MSAADHDQRASGFTLIEIAIVLVVIGLLLSGGLLAIAPVVQQSKVTETRTKIAGVEDALLTYIITNGCLPCPATGNLVSTDANAGSSQGSSGVYTTGCSTTGCTINQGVVPWRTLDIGEAQATDAFGNRLTYGVTAALTQSSNSMLRVGTSYPAGTLTVNDAGGVLTNTAVYVIVSHGPDGSFGFAIDTGTQQADKQSGASANQTENSTADGEFVQLQANLAVGANYFDDIVAFRTGPNVVQACGAGACGNPE